MSRRNRTRLLSVIIASFVSALIGFVYSFTFNQSIFGGIVTGFTMGDDLARVVIVCCAADAQLARIHLTGGIGPHPHDTWLKVQGKVIPGTSSPSTNFVPTMEVTRADPIPKPRNTYAY